MDRFWYSFEIVKATFRVVFTYPKLLIFAVLTACSSIAVVGAFVIPLFFSPSPQSTEYVSDPAEVVETGDPISEKLHQASVSLKTFQKKSEENPIEFYGYLFMFYFCLYFVTVFFNTAIISCVIKALSGERPSLIGGLANALSLIHYIFAWVLLASTVGVVLSVVQNRSNKIGQVLAGIAGFVWSIATFFVVPAMVIERVGPLKAIDSSFETMRKTWGENIVGGVSFGIIFVVLRLFWIVILGAGLLMGGDMILTCFILSLVYLFFIEMMSILIQPVFLAALYLYARDGQVSEGFDGELLQSSFQPSYQQ